MATTDESKLKEMEAKMATKKDVEEMEAKMGHDLKALEAKMATKDDLKGLEAKMATKDDLKAMESRLKQVVVDAVARAVAQEISTRIKIVEDVAQQVEVGFLDSLLATVAHAWNCIADKLGRSRCKEHRLKAHDQ
eukprot:tig00000492_g1461.t1